LALEQEIQTHHENLRGIDSYLKEVPQFEIIPFDRQGEPLQFTMNTVKSLSKKKHRKRRLKEKSLFTRR
jgi:hypothetical protein